MIGVVIMSVETGDWRGGIAHEGESKLRVKARIMIARDSASESRMMARN